VQTNILYFPHHNDEYSKLIPYYLEFIGLTFRYIYIQYVYNVPQYTVVIIIKG
jgi:hypothetical protein